MDGYAAIVDHGDGDGVNLAYTWSDHDHDKDSFRDVISDPIKSISSKYLLIKVKKPTVLTGMGEYLALSFCSLFL